MSRIAAQGKLTTVKRNGLKLVRSSESGLGTQRKRRICRFNMGNPSISVLRIIAISVVASHLTSFRIRDLAASGTFQLVL